MTQGLGPDLLERLKVTEEFRAVQRNFTGATGLPLTVVSATGPTSHEICGEERNAVCAFMREHASVRLACVQLRQKLVRNAAGGLRSVTCAGGQCESAVPIRIGQEVAGFLATGQIYLHQPTAARFEKLCGWLRQRGVEFDEEKLERLYFSAPRLGARRYQAMLGLLEMGAAFLGRTAEEMLRRQEKVFSPAVARACGHIRANLAAPLGLTAVAQVAGLSRYHFSKLFHEETGRTLTEYIARLRVEAAVERLQEPGARVSAVAQSVGFRSHSQFNRVFRRVTGRSPTGHRMDARARVAAAVPVLPVVAAAPEAGFAAKPATIEGANPGLETPRVASLKGRRSEVHYAGSRGPG